ncbi:unnamed protein product [Arabis nemorensis]|uniref:Uncharacterized protein n=1 Tax=Arabis nemorensis TaxID=586526 RepID=A0A565C7P5_9BRAS|nr:unnamed protein product [Arabis nemorensis]
MEVTENAKVQEAVQVADGFTPVRSGRRNAGSQRTQMTVMVGRERGERDRGPRELRKDNNS